VGRAKILWFSLMVFIMVYFKKSKQYFTMVTVVLLLCQISLRAEEKSSDTAGQSTGGRQAIVVIGAAGEAEFEPEFRAWSDRWIKACEKASIQTTLIDGLRAEDTEETSDKNKMLQAIERVKESKATELWVVMLGHGTFDGKAGKFNLRGEDISADELKGVFDNLRVPLVLVNCFSCSGAFLPALSKPGRIVVTSTKSGMEQNYSRFGNYLSQAVGDLSADLDHDRSVSILEAFLKGAKETAKFYEDEKRLATEHPLLDDSGDRQGVLADFFEGIRLIKKAEGNAVVDGEIAATSLLIPSQQDSDLDPEKLVERDRLEEELRQLRRRKSTIESQEYYQALEKIARALTELYQ
jgi:hypothetical protein